MLRIEGQRRRHSGVAAAPQHVFHERMSGVPQMELGLVWGREARNGRAKFQTEARARKQDIESRHGSGRSGDGRGVTSKPGGHLAKNAPDFLQFFLSETYQPVVEINCLERLYKERLTG